MFKEVLILLVFSTIALNALSLQKRDTSILIHEKYANFRPNCFPRGNGKGCTCSLTSATGREEVKQFDKDDDCRKPIEFQTAENKKKVNEEIQQKYGNFRPNCFARGSGKGCSCSVRGAAGEEEVKYFDKDEDCKKPIEFRTAENKKEVNAQILSLASGLKENCFPRPGGKGCRCVEKDSNNQEIEKRYEDEANCKVQTSHSRQRRGNVFGREQDNNQNVRDPIREKAQKNYAAVIQELNDKFRGLKEGCYPRPKGCLCVIGKNAEGREITERRFKDIDCKCRPNDHSRECPAPAA